jgi:HSP20 family protein
MSYPHYSIRSVEGGIALDLEMPAAEKDSIEIKETQGELRIKAKRKKIPGDYLATTKSLRDYEASFTLTKGADREKIEATYEDGLLSVVIPEKEDQTRVIQVR